MLFISRRLSPAETRYHVIELETLGLVWAFQKLVHYLDYSMIHVIIYYSAIRDAFENSKLHRGSYRLVTWRLFFFKYKDRITIVYRPGKAHDNVDALSRLPISAFFTDLAFCYVTNDCSLPSPGIAG